jgi:uncharacterized protein (TIGR02270 family)
VSSRQRFIPELLDVHAEELAYLWGRRRRAANSATLTLRDLAEVNDRIEAHTQGLLVARESLAAHLAPALAGTDRDEVFASAYALLRTSDKDAAGRVLQAFEAATAAPLAGLRDALCLAGIALSEPLMRKLLEGGDAPHAASAAAVLASHKRLDPTPERVAALAADPDPSVAQVAWQVVAALGNASLDIENSYVAAIRGEHAGVREAALGAAVWRGEFWAPGVIRRMAESGDPIGLDWLAAIASADAVPVMTNALSAPLAGVSRSRLAARLGHPALIDLVFDEMASTDPLTASVAGESFTRFTGIDVAGKRKTVAVAESADDFAREFAENVWLPDVARARQAWEQNSSAWKSGTRWCRGCEISSRLAKEDRQRIDLQGLGDFAARAALAGERVMAPPAIA